MLSWRFTYMPDSAPNKPAASAPKPSLLETIKEGNAGYKKLWPFVDKYRLRFIASIVAGAGSAALTFAQLRVIQLVTKHSFGASGESAAAKGEVVMHGAFLDMTLHSVAAGAVRMGPILGHVMLICSLLPLVMMGKCLCDYMENYYMTWVSLKVMHDLRVKLFHHILGQSLDFFNKAKLGSLISRVSNDTRSAQLAITAVTDDIVTQPLTVISIICYMLHTDWRFTLYSLCFFPLCLLPITIFGRRVRKIGRQDETSNAELMVVLHEALAGIRLVKSLGREPHEHAHFTEASNTMIEVSLVVRKAMAVVGPIIESMAGLGVWAALVYVSFSHMQFDHFTGLLSSLVVLYSPVKKLSKVHVSIQKALGATTKIFELLDVEPTIMDSPDAVPLQNCRGAIVFRDVTFTYNPKRPPALRRVSLNIEAANPMRWSAQAARKKHHVLAVDAVL